MANVNQVLTSFRDELVFAGLVRRPPVPGTLPPMHVEPQDGAPGPGDLGRGVEDHPDLVVTLALSTTLGEARIDSYRRRVVLNVHYRAAGTVGLRRARGLDDAIGHRIVRRPDHGLAWVMGALGQRPTVVLSSGIWAGLGRVSATSDRGYHDLAKYVIEVEA